MEKSYEEKLEQLKETYFTACGYQHECKGKTNEEVVHAVRRCRSRDRGVNLGCVHVFEESCDIYPKFHFESIIRSDAEADDRVQFFQFRSMSTKMDDIRACFERGERQDLREMNRINWMKFDRLAAIAEEAKSIEDWLRTEYLNKEGDKDLIRSQFHEKIISLQNRMATEVARPIRQRVIERLEAKISESASAI